MESTAYSNQQYLSPHEEFRMNMINEQPMTMTAENKGDHVLSFMQAQDVVSEGGIMPYNAS